MNMKKLLGYAIAAGVLFLAACKKDNYLEGGTIHNPKVDMTTLDYLKKNPLFDTLCLLIDKAGIADKINKSGISLFTPTDYHINTYIRQKNSIAQQVDESRRYTVDSMIKYDLNSFRDSMDVYIINQALPFSSLSGTAKPFATAFAGITANVSYEEVQDEELGYNPNTGTFPRLVFFEIGDIKTYCQTSGIETNTGMLFVLQNPGGKSSGNPTLYMRQ